MALREGEVWGEITEAGLARLLERKGVARRQRGSLWRNVGVLGREQDGQAVDVFVMSGESNLRYARGIADLNPLYVDAQYAQASPWGRLLAPPATLCYTENVNGATDGFPGCHTIWRSVEYEWLRPLYVDQPILSSTCLTDARMVDSRFAGGKAVIQDYETRAQTEAGEAIGTYRTAWHRFSRKRASGASKYAKLTRHSWSDEELEAVWEEYRTHNRANRRGAQPLYFEDVEIGTEIPHIIKGPVTMTSKLTFEFALGSGWFAGHELALELLESAPRLAIRNEENVPEPPVAIHWTNERCQRYLGMPGAYEAGFERLNWFTQLLMAWSGDHGLLRRMGLEFLAFHWQGDAVRLYGKVSGKRETGAEALVDLEIWSSAHPRGETTSRGTASVRLPRRSSARGA